MRAPPEIIQLSEQVANQIAAGEVVERPAAVVKELGENSLDAGATRIQIEIEDGGRRLIEVSDDGHGMRPADLRRAISRHATSKLSSSDDLFRIATLGFRGEALPSIAAVSEMELASRPHDAIAGQLVRLTGGNETTYQPCAMSPGTRISVRNLFWNVPARLKFLKSEASETGHVHDQVVRLALSHPKVGFRLKVGGRTDIDLPPASTLEARIAALFGPEVAGSLIAVAEQANAMQVSGFVAHPREARPTAKRQYLFLNGRFVKDRILIVAVREGYKGFLEPRLHGTVFLHLDLDPSQVDVNVHPTKSEVRFRREGDVFSLVSKAINAAVAKHAGGFTLLTPADRPQPAAPAAPAPTADSPILSRTVVKAAAPVYQERFLPATPVVTPEVTRPVPAADHIAGFDVPDRPLKTQEPAIAYQAGPFPTPSALLSSAPLPSAPPATDAAATPVPTGPAAPAPDAARVAATQHLPSVRRVVQLNRMFLLIETEHGIRLVDQHALHEKALFNSLAGDADPFAGGRQELLVPLVVRLDAAEVAGLRPLVNELANLGIDLEVAGATEVHVHAHPQALRRLNWAAFLGEVATGGGIDLLRTRLAHRAACHAAVKAGQILNADEQLELVRMLFEMEHMEHCPHGRPTTLDLSWEELAKRFQR